MAVNPDGPAPERQPPGHVADIAAGLESSAHKPQGSASRFAGDMDTELETLGFMIGG